MPFPLDARRLPAAPAAGRGLLPSSLASLAVHAAILLVAAVGLRSCAGSGQRGEADTRWRTVGLVTRTSDSPSEATETPAAPATETAAAPTPELSSAELTASNEPPVALPAAPGHDLPKTLGPGSAAPTFGSPASAELSPTGPVGSAPASPPGLARGETSFLGVKDKGQSFVYLIDTSGSMGNGGKLAVAKAELMASLEALDIEQKFQVIFYNEQPHALRLPGTRPADFYDASSLNRTLARREIAVVQADMGTRHLPALLAAIALKPDVIFFLTDAADVTAPDLEAARRANAGRSRIHCIEFGSGPKLGRESPLERVAASNGGVYQYRNVDRLRR